MSYEEGVTKAKEIGTTYMECSSLKLEGVDEVFDKAMRIFLGISEGVLSEDEKHGKCTLQ